MTELTEPDDSTAQPAPEWPQPVAGDNGQRISDPQVARAVARLSGIPGLPAADHEAVYNGLHDELLAALNSDPIDQVRAATGRAGGAA
ncbi:hypothetical protein [Arthrobacter sp. FW306-06-A]|uniref:hypothetical protein n=1 Tax=Arthrobacter sp. FW306-06-A TaxID=2879621 RepID=UPI001F27081B|nr:hypothetical protein [Arthrobacter sp. FW306-06-A]UKA72698.1 hypothetical protein LFT49_08260 [Arthrobacter sp. FW306-06-A]